MDNIGYQNWSISEQDQSISSSEAGSPPIYGSGTAASGRSRQRDDYSFDISREDSRDYDFSGHSGAAKTGRTSERALYHEIGPAKDRSTLPTRRMSTDDRMKEILSRNQIYSPEKSATGESENGDDAWMRMRESIMEGVTNLAPQNAVRSTATAASNPGQKLLSAPQDTSFNSSGLDISDSLELSATDLEVGAYAARRSKEKTTERRRRYSST